MGDGAEIKSNVTRVGNERDKGLRGHQMNQFNIYNDPSKDSEPFRRIFDSPSVGHVAARFLSTPWTGPRKARRLANTLFVKGPQSAAGSGSTGWHQDRPYFPFDRDPMVMLWLALAPVTSEMGSLRFIDRGNKAAGMGRYAACRLPWMPLELERFQNDREAGIRFENAAIKVQSVFAQ